MGALIIFLGYDMWGFNDKLSGTSLINPSITAKVDFKDNNLYDFEYNNLFGFSSLCKGNNKVIPIRLKIDRFNIMYAFNSVITEDFLAKNLRELPEGCDNARITFLYESDNSLKYIAKINAILERSGTFKYYTPILIKYPSAVLY